MNKYRDYDEITDLPGVLDVVDTFENARVNNNRDYIIALVGIDNFNYYVEKYGVGFETIILQKISDVLKERFDILGFIGHFENDEFYMLLNTDDLKLVINKFKGINEILKNQPLKCEDGEITLKISVGLAIHHCNGDFSNNLVLAQRSLRRVKNSDKNIFYYEIKEIVYWKNTISII